MLIGLDHVVIAVKDLPRATETLAHSLGLSIVPGGRHAGWGTHNAIARFGTEYLELISVYDPAEAATEPRRRVLVDFLGRGEGLLGFSLGSDDLDRDVGEAVERGLRLEGPFPGSRRRPDGGVISWRTAQAPGDPWGNKLPFLIQHDTSLQERRSWSPPEGHPLRVSGVPSVMVAVADLDPAIEDYRRLLGTPPEVVEDVPALPARRARFLVGGFRLELLQPTAPNGGLTDFVRLQGGGLFMVSLAVPDVEKGVQLLRERGTEVGNATVRRRAPLLKPEQTLGARFQLVEGR